ncbi:MAG TPA: xanthine dehydrogenase family protein subunit M [Gemmatimonadaceae bacterium]|nr:xanthine dehydrogenase family protein subunit M [Gemmatimonadaceae bacterium]
MKTAISTLDVRGVTTVRDALAALRDEERTPIAGATDLFVALNFGTLASRRFLDIWRVDELRGIAVNADALVIGALVTYTDLIRSPIIAARLPMLIEASRLVGGPQIQNRGTIGGNIANASPAGDSLPILAAVDATVVLRSATGERRVGFNEFYSGYRASVRRPDELIVAVEIPAVSGRQWFRKVGTRAAQAISKVVIAGVRDGRAARIALGSVAPTVVRARRTEEALANGASIDDAVEVLRREIVPIDDVRSTAEYRRLVSGNLVRRFWTETR